MKKPDTTGMTKEQVIYMEYLEGCLNGANELIVELNLTSKVFAADLTAYRTGEGEIKYIGRSDKTKKFEHVMTLFDKFDKIKALASYFKTDNKNTEQHKGKIPIKIGGNSFEHVVKELSEKNGLSL